MESTRATTNESINIGMTVHPTHQSKHAKKKNYLPRTKPKPLWRSESLLAARSSNSDNFLLHKAKSSELLAGYQSGWKISQDCRRLRFTCMPIMPICVWHAHWHSEWERMSFWPTFFGIVTWGKLNMVCTVSILTKRRVGGTCHGFPLWSAHADCEVHAISCSWEITRVRFVNFHWSQRPMRLHMPSMSLDPNFCPGDSRFEMLQPQTPLPFLCHSPCLQICCNGRHHMFDRFNSMQYFKILRHLKA